MFRQTRLNAGVALISTPGTTGDGGASWGNLLWGSQSGEDLEIQEVEGMRMDGGEVMMPVDDR